MSTLSDFFESAKLPVMSEVAQELIRTLNDENASAAQVEKILAKDPALTANVLRLANSAQFGLSRQVQSLDHAIQLLGMSRVRALALSDSMSAAFPHVPGFDRMEFWNASMACAAYAHWLAALADEDTQQAWLGGMMLRLGELIIAQRSPEALVQIEDYPNHAQMRWERAQNLLGFDETQVTAVMAKYWDFPQAMIDGLQSASNPMDESPFCPLGGILHMAALLADSPYPGAQAVQALPMEVVVALALDPRTLEAQLPSKESMGLASA